MPCGSQSNSSATSSYVARVIWTRPGVPCDSMRLAVFTASPHDIYEWTHPHLAKYAMAGGLVAWGDDRVSATSYLGVPVRDSIIEPRRDVPSLPGDRGGDKVHVVTGTELRSYDLQDRRLGGRRFQSAGSSSQLVSR